MTEHMHTRITTRNKEGGARRRLTGADTGGVENQNHIKGETMGLEIYNKVQNKENNRRLKDSRMLIDVAHQDATMAWHWLVRRLLKRTRC